MWRRILVASSVGMVICIVGFVGSVLLQSFGGDYDKYGRIDVPGSGQVTLPKGEVDIYFAALLTSNGGGVLTVPDLKFDMTGPDGAREPVVTNSDGGSVVVQNAAHARVWKVQVKDAGTYAIDTDGDASAYVHPQLAFGEGSGLPSWPTIVFVVGFVVSLALLLLASNQADRDRSGESAQPARPARPVTTPPGTRTPDQEMARLTQLEQLGDLHTAGTLSDAEYDAAKGRLGS